jgi:hypothetical protein
MVGVPVIEREVGDAIVPIVADLRVHPLYLLRDRENSE